MMYHRRPAQTSVVLYFKSVDVFHRTEVFDNGDDGDRYASSVASIKLLHFAFSYIMNKK